MHAPNGRCAIQRTNAVVAKPVKAKMLSFRSRLEWATEQLRTIFAPSCWNSNYHWCSDFAASPYSIQRQLSRLEHKWVIIGSMLWPFHRTNPRYQRYELSCRTVARKFSIGGLCVCAGVDIPKLNKTQLVYSISRFNFGGLGALLGGPKPTKAPPPWRRDCLLP